MGNPRPIGILLVGAVVSALPCTGQSAPIAPASNPLATHAETREAVQRRVFSGPMASISAGGQARLLQIAERPQGLDSVRVVTFEGRPHLLLRTYESAYTCGIGGAGEPRRQGEAIAEVAFPILRNVGTADTAMSGPFGFAILVRLKVTGSCGNGNSDDSVSMYASADAARQFAAGQITGQQLIDRSSVLFGGNAVEVRLPK